MSPSIIDAMIFVDRSDFLPESVRFRAHHDEALPIGYLQTISQPSTIKFMLSLLAPLAGNCIMDIGAGSGWLSALLAYLVGSTGKVYAIERIPQLFEQSVLNLNKYPELEKRIWSTCKNATDGLPLVAAELGGFDRIISSAEVVNVPDAWKSQLKIGGRLLYPKEGALYLEEQLTRGEFQIHKYHGFNFVPFVL